MQNITFLYILVIFSLIFSFYVYYKKTNTIEGFSYDSIKNLNDLSAKLLAGGITIPGNVTIEGKLSVGKNAHINTSKDQTIYSLIVESGQHGVSINNVGQHIGSATFNNIPIMDKFLQFNTPYKMNSGGPDYPHSNVKWNNGLRPDSSGSQSFYFNKV